jgi:excisionase family DNA binding protein
MENPFIEIQQQIAELKNIVLSIKAEQKPQVEESDKLLSVEEAAAFLSIEKQTLYIWNSQKKVPSMKVGRKLFFSQKELTEFIKAHRRKTISELEVEAKSYKQK